MSRINKLKSKRHRILKVIQSIGPLIEGSLISAKKRCGNPKCLCASLGPIHDTILLTWKENKVTKALYIPKSMKGEIEKWVNEYKKLKEATKNMSAIQKEIFIELKELRKEKKS